MRFARYVAPLRARAKAESCRKRGWRDEASENLEKYKALSGLAHRADLVTFFDYYEVDEGRAP